MYMVTWAMNYIRELSGKVKLENGLIPPFFIITIINILRVTMDCISPFGTGGWGHLGRNKTTKRVVINSDEIDDSK